MENKKLTDAFGHPVEDWQCSMTAGPRGPLLIQDTLFLDKYESFDRERIPERSLHAQGQGAHGYFEVTHDVTKYCKAKIFSEIGKKTQVFCRMSTVFGSRGSSDLLRDMRGFAWKFYTDDGIYDMVGINLPVFFVRDPIKMPDLAHSFKPHF
jgi:catalase